MVHVVTLSTKTIINYQNFLAKDFKDQSIEHKTKIENKNTKNERGYFLESNRLRV